MIGVDSLLYQYTEEQPGGGGCLQENKKTAMLIMTKYKNTKIIKRLFVLQ